MNMKPPIATILLAGISFTAPAAGAGKPGGMVSGERGANPRDATDRSIERNEGAEDAAQPKVDRMNPHDHAALQLGRKVLDLQEAIRTPSAPCAMAAVTALGLDSRYYVMVRGWLSQQLKGDISMLEANQDRTPNEVKERIEFLKKAIRAIDLE
jgi:hypothetical protein